MTQTIQFSTLYEGGTASNRLLFGGVPLAIAGVTFLRDQHRHQTMLLKIFDCVY